MIVATKFRTLIIPLPFGREWRIPMGGPYFKVEDPAYSGWVKPVSEETARRDEAGS